MKRIEKSAAALAVICLAALLAVHMRASAVTTITGRTFSDKIGEVGAPGNTHTLILSGARDQIYDHCNFDGDGIKLDNCVNIQFINCTIQNARRTSGNHQAIQGGGNVGLTFDHLSVVNCDSVAQLYGGQNILWQDCTFSRCNYGYKHGLSGGRNIVVRRLHMQRLRKMGVEFQDDSDGITGILVEDCAYVEPERYDNDSLNDGPSMAFSLPAAKAGITVRGCFVDGESWLLDAAGISTGGKRKSQAGWLGVRVGFEVGGTRPLYVNNWVRNVNDAGAITTSTQAQCYDNLVQNCLEPWNYAAPANGIPAASAGSRVQHNDATVILPAQGGWSLVGVTPPGQAPVPPVNPPSTAPTLEDRVKALEAWRAAMKIVNQ